MPIKSSQTLISEALKEIKTISPEEALKLSNENNCNLIDIRDAIFLAGGAHPLGLKVLRASSGAVFHLPLLRFDGNEEEILSSLLKSLFELSNVGFKIFSTSSHNKSSKKPSKPYWEVDWSRCTALILGNEGQGIHEKIQEAFNETITIPHSELVESLNVACVAVPLLLERKRVAYNSNT